MAVDHGRRKSRAREAVWKRGAFDIQRVVPPSCPHSEILLSNEIRNISTGIQERKSRDNILDALAKRASHLNCSSIIGISSVARTLDSIASGSFLDPKPQRVRELQALFDANRSCVLGFSRKICFAAQPLIDLNFIKKN